MFSKELENSISSLFDQATKTGLQYITVEHLLLMIMEDFEVRDALKASNCNISALNNDVKEFLQDTAITKVKMQNHHNLPWDSKGFCKDLFFMFNHLEKDWLNI